MEFSSNRWKKLAGLIKENNNPSVLDTMEKGQDDLEQLEPHFPKTSADYDELEAFWAQKGFIKPEEGEIKEDWDNYHSLEEIETKYYAKIIEALKSGRAELVKDIFKTALKDAQTLGSIKKGV